MTRGSSSSGRRPVAGGARLGLPLLFAVALALGPASEARAQAAAAPPAAAPAALPAADEILARYREAIGGDRALRQYKSRRLAGRFELPAQGMAGPFELLAAAPDRMRMRLELGGMGEIQRGYDGRVGWSVDPAVGPRLLEGRELDEIRHSADYYYDLRTPESGIRMTVLERAPFEGCDCYAVKVERPSGFELVEYYDAGTGLMAGVRVNSTSPMGTVPAVTVMSEYKQFGALRMPSVLQQRAMGVDTTLRISEVEYDTVPEEAFAPPPAIQGLMNR